MPKLSGDAAAPPEPAKGDDNENKENKEGSENKAWDRLISALL